MPTTMSYPKGDKKERSPDSPSDEMRLAQDVTSYLKEYARERPDVMALWCFGIGFVLGWKLKPW